MLIWLTIAALANDLPDEGFESGALTVWDSTWGDETALNTVDPIEGTASLGIALPGGQTSFAQAGLYHDRAGDYSNVVGLSASLCVAPDPANPPSGDLVASLAIEVFDNDGFIVATVQDTHDADLEAVGELSMTFDVSNAGFARFVVLVTSASGNGGGGFLFDRAWMGVGQPPGCADLMPEPDTGDFDDGDTDGGGETGDPDTVQGVCGCASTNAPVSWLALLPLLALRRRRRVSC